MSATSRLQGLTLAIHPNSRGFGWAALAGPLTAHDGGLVYAETNLNAACIRRAERLIALLSPETLVLEAYERPAGHCTDRVRRLGRALAALAAGQGVEVAVYTKRQVKESFATVGARTRDEIAAAVARHFPLFAPRLPRKRQAFDGLDRRMSLFAAAALALTHYHQDVQLLHADLQDAA